MDLELRAAESTCRLPLLRWFVDDEEEEFVPACQNVQSQKSFISEFDFFRSAIAMVTGVSSDLYRMGVTVEKSEREEPPHESRVLNLADLQSFLNYN